MIESRSGRVCGSYRGESDAVLLAVEGDGEALHGDVAQNGHGRRGHTPVVAPEAQNGARGRAQRSGGEHVTAKSYVTGYRKAALASSSSA